MPKRKRSEEESSSASLSKILSASHNAIFHALKIAKGHERQRQSKRLHDPQTDQQKRARLQNEIIILKSLDLHAIALTHLRAALLRTKTIAECDRLPAEVKAPAPKPDLTEDEEKALHNVTSCLFAKPEVKKETEKAIDLVGKALGVEVPEKKKGRIREKKLEKLLKEKDHTKEGEDTASASKQDAETEQDEQATTKPKQKAEKRADEIKKKLGIAANTSTNGGGGEDSESDVDETADKEEQALAKLDDLLGSSSEDEVDEDFIAAAKAKKKAGILVVDELDPMEITSGEEDEADEYDDMGEEYDLNSDGDSEDNDASEEDENDKESASGSESGSFQGFSDDEGDNQNSAASESSESASESASESESSAVLSPPRKKKATSSSSASGGGGKPSSSTFLPSLMGGYISDSNSSASDLDIAPNSRKNRRGQRARQAIWEKKYKEQARHLREGTNSNANKRDSGWDLKRGAVDPAAAGKPWKMGIKNPLLEKDKPKGGDDGQEGGVGGGRTLPHNARGGGGGTAGRGGKAAAGVGADRPLNRKERRAMGIKTPVGPPGGGSGQGGGGARPPAAGMPAKKRDDEGPLHPSWEARKKAKAQLETAPFQGKKITFD